MSALWFYAVVGVSASVRALVSRLPANRGMGSDIGDVLLGGILAAVWLASGRRDPSEVIGVVVRGRRPGMMRASVAAVIALSAVNAAMRRWIVNRYSDWVRSTGVNPGGAFLAVSVLPLRLAVLAGLTYTSSGALLEELVFRWLIMGWVSRAGGRAVGMAAQAILFGLVHAVPMAAHHAPAQVVSYAFAMPLACALVLGWLTLAGEGLVWAWLVHWALNYIAVISALRAGRADRMTAGRKAGPSAEL